MVIADSTDATPSNEIIEAIDGGPEYLDDFLSTNAAHRGQLSSLPILQRAVGESKCVKVLLQYGARHTVKEKDTDIQALHSAVLGDYIESVILLIIHGANVNAKTKEGKTPLQIAAERTSSSCYDFIQLADGTMDQKAVDSLLKDSARDNYWNIRKSYDKKTLRHACVRHNGTDRQQTFQNIGVSLTDYPPDPFNMFVSRMQQVDQASCMRIPKIQLPDHADLVSDVFHYKVDAEFKCTLHIELNEHPKLNDYKEIVVFEKADGDEDTAKMEIMYTDVVYDGRKKVSVKNFGLKFARKSQVIAFAVFVRNKIDESVVQADGKTVIKSRTDPTFRVEAEPESELSNRRVTLEIVENTSSDESNLDSDSGIGSSSDFCSIRSEESDSMAARSPSNSRPGSAVSTRSNNDSMYKVVVTLPKPTAEECHVLRGDENGFEEHRDVEQDERVMKCKNPKEGNFIVIFAKKITVLVKEKVMAMWEAANGCKKMCRVFATVQPRPNPGLSSSYKYLVEVYLCVQTDYDKILQKIRTEDMSFAEKERRVRSTHLDLEVNIKSTYTYTLNITYGTINGARKSHVVFKDGQKKINEFIVLSEEEDFVGHVILSKASVTSRWKKKLPLECVKKKPISGNVYLNDNYLQDVLVGKLQRKWFMFGIYLEMPFAKLEAYEDIGTTDACRKVLFYWRDDRYDGEHQRLDRFFKATFSAELPDLRIEILLNHIHIFKRHNKEIESWYKMYHTAGNNRTAEFDFLPLKSLAVSPLSDCFLMLLSKTMDELDENTAVQLGLKGSEYREVTRNKLAPDFYNHCKVLSRVRDKHSKKVKFLKMITTHLKSNGKELILQEITSPVQHWYNSEDEDNNRSLMKQIHKIFRLR